MLRYEVKYLEAFCLACEIQRLGRPVIVVFILSFFLIWCKAELQVNVFYFAYLICFKESSEILFELF